MAFLDLPIELVVFILALDLNAEHATRRNLLIPMDRLTHYLSVRHRHPARKPLCLTPCAAEVDILSGQATACVEDRAHALPRIFELCQVCSTIRLAIMNSPRLWASQALCWPAHSTVVIARARECYLTLTSPEGLCACIFRDIKPMLHRAARIELILPSIYVRADGAHLLTASLMHPELARAQHLTDIQLRVDGYGKYDDFTMLPTISMPSLRRARLQNVPFIIEGPNLEDLQISMEPGGPTFTLRQLLQSICHSRSLKELVIQMAIRDARVLPWEAGIPCGTEFSLPHLRHLSCSGPRGLTRSLLYWVAVPSAVDIAIDAELDLGSIVDPLEQLQPQLTAEMCILVQPAESRSMLEYVRARLESEIQPGAIAPSQHAPVYASTPLPYLALNVIPDDEAEHPLQMWPRFVTIAAAQDFDGAVLSVSQEGHPTSLGPGRLRRTFTMRNRFAAFPSTSSVTLRESFPRDRRPWHLGFAVDLPLRAYIRQADAEEHVTHLLFAETSWVPRTEDEWLFVLSDLPRLRSIIVMSTIDPECMRSLAGYLWRDRGNEDLREVTCRNSGLGRLAIQLLQAQVVSLSTSRETADSEWELPSIVWNLD